MSLTNRPLDIVSEPDGPARDDCEEGYEIEITDEMIEAGLPALWEYDPHFSNERDVVARIFALMNSARRSGCIGS
jgi:hypothetical protein